MPHSVTKKKKKTVSRRKYSALLPQRQGSNASGLGFLQDSDSLLSPWLPRNPSKRPQTQKDALSMVVGSVRPLPKAAQRGGSRWLQEGNSDPGLVCS